jgi:hypothetical protein
MNQASIRAFGHNPFTMRRFVVNLTNRLFVVNEGLSATAALNSPLVLIGNTVAIRDMVQPFEISFGINPKREDSCQICAADCLSPSTLSGD